MGKVDELVKVCTSSDSYQINLKRKIDLKKLESGLSKDWVVVASTPVVLLIKALDESSISVYQSGKILFKKFNKKGAEEYAKKFLQSINHLL